MAKTLRRFMLIEAGTFIVAAVVLAGLLIAGEHREARIAESVIALVLLAGATLTSIWPASARVTGLAAQGFALLGRSSASSRSRSESVPAPRPTSSITSPSWPSFYGACWWRGAHEWAPDVDRVAHEHTPDRNAR